jgi:hypothetical protein
MYTHQLSASSTGEQRRAEQLAALQAKRHEAAASVREAQERRRALEEQRLAQLASKQQRKADAQVGQGTSACCKVSCSKQQYKAANRAGGEGAAKQQHRLGAQTGYRGAGAEEHMGRNFHARCCCEWLHGHLQTWSRTPSLQFPL